MVFFRSPTMTSAIDIVKGLMGLNGVALPQALVDQPGPLHAVLRGLGVVAAKSWSFADFSQLAIWIFVLMAVALGCPNTIRILSHYEPALGVKPRPTTHGIERFLEWNASLPWAITVSGIAAIAIVSIRGPSEFLYWQF
jgi:hypothetical protein